MKTAFKKKTGIEQGQVLPLLELMTCRHLLLASHRPPEAWGSGAMQPQGASLLMPFPTYK